MTVATPAIPGARAFDFWIAAAVVLVATGCAWWVLRDVRGLPDYDYWYMLPTWLGDGGLNLTYDGLYARSNEHVIAVAKLFYSFNYLVTGGDNLGLSALNLAFSLMIGLLFARMAVLGGVGAFAAALLGIAISAAVFTPFASHNFFLPMSGVAWIGANMFFVAGAYVMFRAMERGSVALMILAASLALVASQTYSTGILAPLALAAQALMSTEKRHRGWGAVLLALGIVVFLYIAATQPVREQGDIRNYAIVPVIRYALAFVGGGLTRDYDLARAIGTIGGAYFLVMMWFTHTSRQRLLQCFWIAVALYAIGNGVLGGVGRSLYFPDSALSQRYASLPSLFWLALLGLTISNLVVRQGAEARPEPRRRMRVGLRVGAGVAAAMAILIVWQGRHIPALYGKRIADKNKAALAVYVGANDHILLPPVSGQHTEFEIVATRPTLQAAGHFPFNGMFSACPRLGALLTMSPRRGAVTGHFDSLQWVVPRISARVTGWAANSSDGASLLAFTPPGRRPADCVVLADEGGRVRGLALGGIARADVGRALRSPAGTHSGWSGYVALPEGGGPVELTAYGREQGTERWSSLSSSFLVSGDRIEKTD